MTASDLAAAVRPVAEALEALGVTFYLTGSVASSAHGIARESGCRRGGETSERQWWDIIGVLRVTADVDGSYLRHWAAALGVSDLLERARADAGA